MWKYTFDSEFEESLATRYITKIVQPFKVYNEVVKLKFVYQPVWFNFVKKAKKPQ